MTFITLFKVHNEAMVKKLKSEEMIFIDWFFMPKQTK